MSPARNIQRQAADEQRFTRLAETTGPRVLAYLSRRVDPPGDAADVLAEVLATAWRRVADLPADDEEASAWLFGIARGTLANYRRGQTRRHALADRLRTHLEHRLREAAPPADETVAVRDALTRLPTDDRELLTLVAWDGLRTDEAAALLGITSAAARQRLVRARRRLRAELDEATGPTSGDRGLGDVHAHGHLAPSPGQTVAASCVVGPMESSGGRCGAGNAPERRVPIPSTEVEDVIPLVIPPGATRPDWSVLAGRPT